MCYNNNNKNIIVFEHTANIFFSQSRYFALWRQSPAWDRPHNTSPIK